MAHDSITSAVMSSNTPERRGKLLLDATIQYCNQRHSKNRESTDQYSKLFYSLIGDIEPVIRKKIASHLARNKNTPRPIAYYLAMESSDIAAPFLLISTVFWERDLLQLIANVREASLSVIARRSDINAKTAQAIVDRGDKLACSILSKNPVLKINSITQSIRKTSAVNSAAQASATLVELAGMGGKLGRKTVSPEIPITAQAKRSASLSTSLLEYARNGDIANLCQTISEAIDLPISDIERLVKHETSNSLVVFLKGMRLSKTVTSQLLLLLNKRTVRNIAEFSNSMAQFDCLSIDQCQEVMRKSGANNTIKEDSYPALLSQDTQLAQALGARRRQFSKPNTPPLFGLQRKAS